MKKLALVLALAGSTGCSFINSIIFGAEDTAGRGVGSAIASNAMGGSSSSTTTTSQPSAAPAGSSAGGGASGGGMSGAYMNPAFMNIYMNMIFTYAFSSGGYEVAPAAYKPGDYTRWEGYGQDGKKLHLERAYLADDAKGRQWWKVKWTDEQEKTIILEGLLDLQQKRFVRMRAKFPEDAEGKEMPVDEATYYHPPQKLSAESIEGATKGSESVSVPAGTFTAQHVVFGGMDGTHEWWLDTKVPGGTVKQAMRGPKDEKARWDMDLTAYGSDAKSELGSK